MQKVQSQCTSAFAREARGESCLSSADRRRAVWCCRPQWAPLEKLRHSAGQRLLCFGPPHCWRAWSANSEAARESVESHSQKSSFASPTRECLPWGAGCADLQSGLEHPLSSGGIALSCGRASTCALFPECSQSQKHRQTCGLHVSLIHSQPTNAAEHPLPNKIFENGSCKRSKCENEPERQIDTKELTVVDVQVKIVILQFAQHTDYPLVAQVFLLEVKDNALWRHSV